MIEEKTDKDVKEVLRYNRRLIAEGKEPLLFLEREDKILDIRPDINLIIESFRNGPARPPLNDVLINELAMVFRCWPVFHPYLLKWTPRMLGNFCLSFPPETDRNLQELAAFLCVNKIIVVKWPYQEIEFRPFLKKRHDDAMRQERRDRAREILSSDEAQLRRFFDIHGLDKTAVSPEHKALIRDKIDWVKNQVENQFVDGKQRDLLDLNPLIWAEKGDFKEYAKRLGVSVQAIYSWYHDIVEISNRYE